MSDQPPIRPASASGSIQLLVHGHPGVGKTTLIGSGGKTFNTLIIRPPTDHLDAILGQDCQEWVVKEWGQMEEVEQYLEHEGNIWDWVWLDSISGWQNHGLDDVWADVLARRPDRKGGPIDKGEYGRNMTRILQWIRHVQGISEAGNFHFGITAWSEYLWEESIQQDILKPWVQGKMMSDSVMGYMNVVAYMDKLRGKQNKLLKNENGRARRVLRFDMTDEYYAKDDFNAFERDRLVDPTLPQIVEAVESKRIASTKANAKPAAKRRRRRKS